MTERWENNKYAVIRSGPSADKHVDCIFFVLDLIHDPHAIPALLAYAESCKGDNPALSMDILDKLGMLMFYGEFEWSGSEHILETLNEVIQYAKEES